MRMSPAVGAILMSVVTLVAGMALADVPKPLTTKDLTSAAGSVRPSTREWFSTARNYALYSNQGGVYDDILKYLKM